MNNHEKPVIVKYCDTIKFGSYIQNSDTKEPIEWYILANQENSFLLMSKYVLEVKAYHDNCEEMVTWQTCSLRKWLNHEFMDIAFTEEEKQRIRKIALYSDHNPDFDVDFETEHTDSVFLPSISEVEKYFKRWSLFLAEPTKHVRKRNPYLHYDLDTCYFWLRAFGEDGWNASIINSEGRVNVDGASSGDTGIGVRPALWIRCEEEYQYKISGIDEKGIPF